MRNMVQYFLENSIDNQVAICQDSKTVTYGEMKEKIKRIQSGLINQGISRNDKLFILMPVDISFYETLFAIWGLGASVVVFDSAFTSENIVDVMKNTDIKAFIVHEEKEKEAMVFVKQVLSIESLLNSTNVMQDVMCCTDNDDDLALLSFTSGTVRKKGILRSFEFLTHQYTKSQKMMQFKNTDKVMSTMPFVNVLTLIAGATLYLPGEEKSLFMILDKITFFILAPSMVLKMASMKQMHPELDLSAVKTVLLGGGPIYPHIVECADIIFSNAKVYGVYGSVEAEPIAIVEFGELSESIMNSMKQGNVGLAAGFVHEEMQVEIFPSVAGEVIKDMSEKEFEERKALKGEIGEIVVSGNGENVIPPLLNNIGAEESRFKVGDTVWHRTGDLGRFGEEDFLSFYGKLNAEPIRNVYPVCAESRLYSLYGAKQAAYMGIDGKAVLFVVCEKEWKEKISMQETYADEVIILPEIPLDTKHHTKIDYKKLREIYLEEK